MSTFGRALRVTTFGESHGKGVGCVLDGLPGNLKLSLSKIQAQLDRRRPGQSKLTTQRDEKDRVSILSGVEWMDSDVFMTLGTPIAMLVSNEDQRTFDYANTQVIPRPGHADFAYKHKFGIAASSGGGRASARETIGRVAAGAAAEQWLQLRTAECPGCSNTSSLSTVAFVVAVKDVAVPKEIVNEWKANPPTREQVDSLGMVYLSADNRKFADHIGRVLIDDDKVVRGENEELERIDPESLRQWSVLSTRCPHAETAARIAQLIHQTRLQKDTVGGETMCIVQGVPQGLGEPVFDKLPALLAHAMMSLPATKGFEIGEGFAAAREMTGSMHNDRFTVWGAGEDMTLIPASNSAGGTLGGISSGTNLVLRVAFKPVSSIGIEQRTADASGEDTTLTVKGRHDPCVLPRTPPLVEAMTALVLGDMLLQQLSRS